MNRRLHFLVVGLVGLAIGWLVGAPRGSGSSDASAGSQFSTKSSPRNSSRTTPVTLGSGHTYSDAATTLTTLFARDDEALVREFTRLQQIPHSAPGRPLDELLLTSIAFELGRRSDDPAAMIKSLAEGSLVSRSHRRSYYDYANHGVLTGWAWRDPEAASRYAIAANLAEHSPLVVLAERDPDRALALAAEFADEKSLNRLYPAVQWGLAKRDPASAIDLALEFADPKVWYERGGDGVYRSMLGGLDTAGLRMAIAKVEAALAAGATLPYEVLSEALGALAATDPEAATAAYLRNAGTTLLDPSDLLNAWAYGDPTAAIDWARTNLGDEVRERAVQQCLRQWIRAEPLASWAALNDPQSPYHGLATTEEWIAGAGITFEGAAPLGQADPVRENLIRGVLDGASDLPLDFAVKLAMGDVPADLQTEVMERLVAAPEMETGRVAWGLRSEDVTSSDTLARWANSAPDAAATLLRNLPPDQAERALFSVAGGVAEVYPSLAAELVTAQPASPARDYALQFVAAHWAQQDPRAAIAWAQSLPSGPARDLAIHNAITQGSAFDPSLSEPD